MKQILVDYTVTFTYKFMSPPFTTSTHSLVELFAPYLLFSRKPLSMARGIILLLLVTPLAISMALPSLSTRIEGSVIGERSNLFSQLHSDNSSPTENKLQPGPLFILVIYQGSMSFESSKTTITSTLLVIIIWLLVQVKSPLHRRHMR